MIANPRTDYGALYDEQYYAGNGADHCINYLAELNAPQTTLRRLEWRGILRAVGSLVGDLGSVEWLDFGCGYGGLVRAGRQAGVRIHGYDEGWICGRAREEGIPVLDAEDLEGLKGTMDVVTAIEVLEHVLDPVAVLRQIRDLLKPGGILFLTTGNAKPHRNNLPSWSYVIPEIHLGYFEPETMAEAMRRSGFEPKFPGFLPGFTDIIHVKVLRFFGRCYSSAWERLVPWPLVTRVVDRRFQVTAHPVGRAVVTGLGGASAPRGPN
jgi:SAM-dependent methyltransferase